MYETSEFSTVIFIKLDCKMLKKVFLIHIEETEEKAKEN